MWQIMTYYNDIISVFLNLIENDTEFFNYFSDDEELNQQIVIRRASNLLYEASTYLFLKTGNTVFVADAATNTFESDLSATEIKLVAKTMLLIYLQREISKLRAKVNVFTSSDLIALHSPANERSSFMNMVKDYENTLINEISEYVMLDQESGGFKPICT